MGCPSLGTSVEFQQCGCHFLGISVSFSVGCHTLVISVEFQCGVSFSGNKCGVSSVGCQSLGISVEFQQCGVSISGNKCGVSIGWGVILR